jgi:hypothetical protein
MRRDVEVTRVAPQLLIEIALLLTLTPQSTRASDRGHPEDATEPAALPWGLLVVLHVGASLVVVRSSVSSTPEGATPLQAPEVAGSPGAAWPLRAAISGSRP